MIRNNITNEEITNVVKVVKATSTYSTKVKFLAKVMVKHLIIATYQRLKSDRV